MNIVLSWSDWSDSVHCGGNDSFISCTVMTKIVSPGPGPVLLPELHRHTNMAFHSRFGVWFSVQLVEYVRFLKQPNKYFLWRNSWTGALAASFLRFLYLPQLNKHTRARAVGLLWTSDQPVAETGTYRTRYRHTRDEHLCPQEDQNPLSQHMSGCRPTP
jgi:hypothetical protein